MEVKDILALANAGFTAEQITLLARTTEKAPEQPPAPKQPPEQPPEQPPAPAPKTPAGIDQIMQEIRELKQTAVLGNILTSAQPKEQSADEILAMVINPPAPDRDKGGMKNG